MVALNSNLHGMVRMGLRAFEFVCALIAMSTLGASFKSYETYSGPSMMLGSHGGNFTLLVNYTALVYSLYVVVAVERLNLAARFPLKTDMMVDGVMALLLFIAGIVLATSDYVADCDNYGDAIRCGNIKTTTAFTFIGMVGFLGSLGLTVMTQNNGSSDTVNMDPIPYVEESTPTGNLSPMGGGASTPIATKV